MTERTDNPGTRRLAVSAAVATGVLILAGGFVTTTQTGDTIPTWPWTALTGEAGDWIEGAHRVIAAAVGLLVLALAVVVQKADPRGWVKRLAWIALAAVVVQAVLGGLRVHRLSPLAVAVVHATFAQLIFGIVVAVAVFAGRGWRDAEPDGDLWAARKLGVLTVAFTVAQLILGALARHAGVLVWVHVGNALLVLVHGALLASRLRTTPLKAGGTALLALLGVQVALGFVTLAITLGGFERSVSAPVLEILAVTAHVAVGALFLATSLALTLRCWRAAVPSPELGLART